ncbi:MAG: hypothetical protein H8D65_01105 [Spirochaetes bacterium]|nr:hypothetical protein [Spirochaetota bacterium]
MNTTLTRKAIVRRLLIIAVCLIGLSVLTIISTYGFGRGNIYGLIPLFNLDGEKNFPTIYSTVLLAASAFLFFFLSKQARTEDIRSSRKFKFLGGVMAFVALDEISSIHELLTTPVKELGNFDGVFFHSWVIVFIPLLLLLFLYLFKFIFSQPKEFRNGLILAAFLYVSGALGLEMVEGFFSSSTGSRITLTTAVLANIEESLEIFGIIILINSLLKFAAINERTHRIQLIFNIEEE